VVGEDRCVTKVFGAFNNPAESLYVDIVETLDEIYCTQKCSSDVRFKAKIYLDSLLKYENNNNEPNFFTNIHINYATFVVFADKKIRYF
jgi:hypothetical protein